MKHVEQGDILLYVRYADDILCIVEKNIEKTIFNEINNFDPQYLAFKSEYITGNSIPFLDTEVLINKNQKLELKKYRKPMASNVVLNYNVVTPKKYKIGCLKGDIYRCNNTTSTEKTVMMP